MFNVSSLDSPATGRCLCRSGRCMKHAGSGHPLLGSEHLLSHPPAYTLGQVNLCEGKFPHVQSSTNSNSSLVPCCASICANSGHGTWDVINAHSLFLWVTFRESLHHLMLRSRCRANLGKTNFFLFAETSPSLVYKL